MNSGSLAEGPVTWKCTKVHEAAKFHEWEPMFMAVEFIGKACLSLPFHFIFGAEQDVV